jgi:hypothetical protein
MADTRDSSVVAVVAVAVKICHESKTVSKVSVLITAVSIDRRLLFLHTISTMLFVCLPSFWRKNA